MVGTFGIVGSGGTANFAALRSQLTASRSRTSNAKQQVAQIKAEREAMNASGQAMTGAGQQQSMIGTAMVGSGGVLSAVGSSLMGAGAAASPFGWGLFLTGLGITLAGAATTTMGQIKMTEGNADINEGTQLISDAIAKGDVEKSQGKIATLEMNRSNVLEQKIRFQEVAMQTLRQEAQQQRSGTLTDDQINQLEGNIKKGIDKLFKEGATILRDGGIIHNEDNDKYYIQKQDGTFGEIAVKMDPNTGRPERGNFGELQIDDTVPMQDVQAGGTLDLLLLSKQFMADKFKEGFLGDADNPARQRLELMDDGTIITTEYDPTNPAHMSEFLQIVEASEQQPRPLRYFRNANGELGFQKWNWDTNQPGDQSVFVTMAELTDKNTTEDAFARLNLGPGSARYGLLDQIAQNSFDADKLVADDANTAGNNARSRLADARNNAMNQAGSQRGNGPLTGNNSSSGSNSGSNNNTQNTMGSA